MKKVFIILIFLSFITLYLFLLFRAYAQSNISQVKSGDKVALVKPLKDGLTYIVQTPYGIEKWKDRDLYYIAAHEESCTVIKSYSTEVLIYVPIMDNRYWFTVLESL